MRILPPLPATAQLSAPAGVGQMTTGRVIAAEVVTPVGNDLYEMLAGQLSLQVRSTNALQAGQRVQLQLVQDPGRNAAQWQVLDAADETGGAGENSRLPGQGLASAQPAGAANMPASLSAAILTRLAAQLAAGATGTTSTANPAPAGTTTQTTAQTASGGQSALTSSAAGSNPLAAAMAGPGAGERLPAALAAYREQPITLVTDQDAADPASARPLPSSRAAGSAAPALVTGTSHLSPGPEADVTDSAGSAREIRQHLQALLPRQQDPGRLLALLQALQPALAEPATSPLQAAASRLLASLPEAARLTTPEAIKQVLQDSGLLTADTPAGHGQNLKQALQALLQAAPDNLPGAPLRHGVGAGHLQPMANADLGSLAGLRDAAPLLLQLAAEAEPVLARMESHQLMHLQQADSPVQQWLFELPLRHGQDINLWQLHIEKDQRRTPDDNGGGECRWALTLSVDFPETGALMVRLGLQGNQLHAHFHAASGDTLEQVRTQLPGLRAALESQGIAAPLLTCQRGLPHRDTLPAMPRNLMEVSA